MRNFLIFVGPRVYQEKKAFGAVVNIRVYLQLIFVLQISLILTLAQNAESDEIKIVMNTKICYMVVGCSPLPPRNKI
jgi:hypothetical protein